MFHPYKLWSLWDMLRIFADDFMNIGSTMTSIGHYLHIDKTSVTEPDEDFCEALKKTLIKLKADCDKLNLKVSSGLLRKSINDLPQSSRELKIIVNAIKEEIRSNLFLYIPSHRANYHELASKIEPLTSFPYATKEIIRAGSCYAVGEYTACVFHSMRAAELGLRSLAKHLNVSFPYPLELADWQNIIDKIESSIKNLNQLPKSAEKDKELKFCSEAAAQFRYFKDAYRKHVAHAREIYDEYQAISVMGKTTEFMRVLSNNLSE